MFDKISDAYALQLLSFIGSSDEPVLCDWYEVRKLLAAGLVQPSEMGWIISPNGMLRLRLRTD